MSLLLNYLIDCSILMRSLHAVFVWAYWCFICICVCVCVKYMMCVVGSGLGMSQSSRLSSSVSAMRVLNTGSDVEEALADALVNIYSHTQELCLHLTHT